MRLVFVVIAMAGLFSAPVFADELEDARAAVVKKLKDPESARFGDLTLKNREVVCGTVNARMPWAVIPEPISFIMRLRSNGHLLRAVETFPLIR